MSMNNLNVCDEIKRAIDDLGFESWTEIQEKTIPILQQGNDVIGQSQTGTGKTIAFGLPALQKVDVSNKKTQVIVICPTRELALQVCNEMRKLTKYMSDLKLAAVYGGEDITKQIRELKKGVQVVIGTPGRIIDHINRKTLKLDCTNTIILDEADEMLKMGFREDIEQILTVLPEDRQTILFSATMPKPIIELTKKYQNNPVHVKVKPKNVTASTVLQEYAELNGKHKSEAVSRILKISNVNLAIVFCNTKDKVDKVCEDLLKKGFKVDKIHGDLTQNLRLKVLKNLESGLIKVLVATDVAARGIDIKNVELVVNFDVPDKEEYYVHRIGRSGRAGKAGRAVTLVGEKDKSRLRAIEKYINKELTKINIPTLDEVKAKNIEKYINDINKTIERGITRKRELYESIVEKLKDANNVDDILVALVKLNLKLADDYELNDINTIFKEKKAQKRNNASKSRIKDGMQRIFLNVGRCHGVRKLELLKYIEKESGIKRDRIDDLDIFENFSFFTIRQGDVKTILTSLSDKKYGKAKIKAEKAKK